MDVRDSLRAKVRQLLEPWAGQRIRRLELLNKPAIRRVRDAYQEQLGDKKAAALGMHMVTGTTMPLSSLA